DLERLIDYARVADITTTIKGHHDSIKLVIQGYTPKMLDLLTLILNHIKEFVPSELHFATVKEKQLRELANYVHKESDDYTYKWISYVHTTDGITVDEAVAILEKLDLERLRGLVQRILQSFYTKILVVGNFEEVFALRVHEAVTETFKPQPIVPADINPNRFLLQRKDRHIIHRRSPNESSPLSAVNHTIYCSSRINIEDYAYLLLLTTLADEKLYTMLRTNEAMGYVVYCTVLTATSERTGISFVVKSECNPAYIQLRIDEFFRRFREDVLTNLSDDEFESAVEAEIESCERPDTDIYEEFDTYARWIRAGVHLFDYRKQRVDVLHEATREKLVSFWDERLAPLQPERAPSLTAHVYSAMIRMPTLAERRVYPGTVIALVGCLERDSIRGLDYRVVNDVVAGLRGEKCAAMDYIVRQFKDHLLSRYPSINKDSLDKAFKSEESYSSVALAAAIGSEFVKKQDPRGSRSSGESDIVFETPDGHYILEDHVAYRGLLVEAEPLSLASKYTAKYPEAAATDLDEDELGC
ncbi:metalloprotease, partial [Spiromyces aspiralis]